MKRALVATAVALIAWFSLSDNLPPTIPRALADLPPASGAKTASPLNYDFTAGEPVVAAPLNYGFEAGLNNWTVSGSSPGNAWAPTSGGYGGGRYLRIEWGGFSGPYVDSAAFTVQSSAPMWTFYFQRFSGSGSAMVYISTEAGGYTNWTQIYSSGSTSTSDWLKHVLDLTSYVGQSVKIRYRAFFAAVGFDEGATRKIPNWTVTNGKPYWEPNVSIPATTGSTGDFTGGDGICKGASVPASTAPAARLNGITAVQSEPFTIPGDSNRLSFLVKGEGSGATLNAYVYLASESYATQHIIFSKTIAAAGMFTTCEVPSGWAGQDVKVRVRSESGGDILVAIAGLTSGSLSAKSEIQVDPVSLISGTQMHSHTDLAIPGKGIPLEFSRSYISSGSPVQGSLGWGWTHNYETGLTIYTSGDVGVRYPSGGSAFFKNNAGTLTAPKGVYDTLVKNGDNTYTLTTKAQIKLNYDTGGKLASIVDRNSNTTTVVYDGNGRIATVTAPGGRQLTFTPDGNGRIQQISDPLSRTVQFGYDGNGDLTTVTDVKSGVTTYTYSSHRLLTIKDSLNQVQLTDIYDEVGRVAERRDAVNGVTCYYYGYGPTYTSGSCPGVSPAPQAGEAVEVDPRGNKLTYQFDKNFRTTGVKDALGNVTLYAYEATGSLCSPADNGNRCSITDPLSHVTSFTYDSKGNVLTETNAVSKTWTYTYTSNNDVDLATDPLSRQADYIYDSAGNLTRVVDKDSFGAVKALTCYERDSSGLATAIVDSTDLVVPAGATDQCTGNRTLLGYDTYGNQTCEVNPRFASPSQSCSQIATKGTFAYDNGHRLQSETNVLRQPVSTAESGGQCGTAGTGNGVDDDSDTVKDDGCASTAYTYDNQNNVTSVTDAVGNKSSTSYNLKGLATNATDANRATVGTAESGSLQCGTAGTGNGVDDDADTVKDDGCPSAIYNYDAAGRTTSEIDALGQTSTYLYGDLVNLTAVINAKRQAQGAAESGSQCGTAGTGNGVDDDGDTVKDDGCPSAKYAYDALNRRESETDALGRIASYTYWEDSTLKQRTDARGLVTKYFPDAVQRPDLIEYWNGGQLASSVDYSYDDAGNRLTMVDPTGTTSYQYDALNRLTSVTSPGPKTVAYRYDNTGAQGEDPAKYPGQRTKVTYPDSKAVVYTFEADGSMKTVTDWLSKTTTYNYDNSGRLTSTTLGNGLITDNTYDDANRLLTLVNRDGGATISSYGYTLDKAGNRAQVVDTSGTTAYAYDALYRLTGADYPGTADDTTYTYDAMGNRLTHVKNGTPSSYTYDDADEMLTAGGVSYSYDNNGNQTGRASDTFGWDHENRLTSTNTGGTAGSYTYNGDGLRVSRTLGGSSVSYTWDVAGGLPVILQDSAGNTYVYGLGLISRTDSGGAQEYYLTDGLGSTTGIADGNKNVVATYQYDAFGAVRAQTGSSPNEFKFTGEQVDSSGLQFLRARYYDQATGRFLARDPVESLQRYAYAENNPVNLADPTGEEPTAGTLFMFRAAMLGGASPYLAAAIVLMIVANDILVDCLAPNVNSPFIGGYCTGERGMVWDLFEIVVEGGGEMAQNAGHGIQEIAKGIITSFAAKDIPLPKGAQKLKGDQGYRLKDGTIYKPLKEGQASNHGETGHQERTHGGKREYRNVKCCDENGNLVPVEGEAGKWKPAH